VSLSRPTDETFLAEVRRATATLQRLVADKSVLYQFSDADRKALLAAAGQLSSPERGLLKRVNKAQKRREQTAKREADLKLRDEAAIRVARTATTFVAPKLLSSGERASRGQLNTARACYVCKAPFTELHFFYDSMCVACGDFNYDKRFQKADLRGHVALVTGARVKIGYHIGLFLLRNGAEVLATTRFPNDAVTRYAQEPDFAEWKDRLHVFGLDLRHSPSVELFAHHVASTFERLDILINNAAQTVRRPPAYYAHLLAHESAAFRQLNEGPRALLNSHNALTQTLSSTQSAADSLSVSWQRHDPGLGIVNSAALSQLPYAFDPDVAEATHLFPSGRLDADRQQVDLRTVNSWRLKLHEVQTAEMLEVHLVNAVAPFVLCSKLKPLMERKRDVKGHVVNVSAMEGSFSRGTKTDKHPHTNMAKAALNMLTLTSSKDFADSGIYMNAVDTGWVTDEDPVTHATRKTQELGFEPPLDIVDGAARVIDPVFEAVRTQHFVHGLFLKDYKKTSW
jgi:NAD(P)-dependent dehydrogenase (short-subunit alcohol dehydrogenase family)